MNNTEQDTYRALIDRIRGDKPTYSLEDAIPYDEMKRFNEGMAEDRLEARRKAAASQQKASRIILNA
ncbi:MAG: hypothetical protein EAZ91_18840 [Cytophagales bacterium]|nr:MAG: hypothetical protein EAZ91_18840 [Cytophagales bacterium]